MHARLTQGPQALSETLPLGRAEVGRPVDRGQRRLEHRLVEGTLEGGRSDGSCAPRRPRGSLRCRIPCRARPSRRQSRDPSPRVGQAGPEGFEPIDLAVVDRAGEIRHAEPCERLSRSVLPAHCPCAKLFSFRSPFGPTFVLPSRPKKTPERAAAGLLPFYFRGRVSSPLVVRHRGVVGNGWATSHGRFAPPCSSQSSSSARLKRRRAESFRCGMRPAEASA